MKKYKAESQFSSVSLCDRYTDIIEYTHYTCPRCNFKIRFTEKDFHRYELNKTTKYKWGAGSFVGNSNSFLEFECPECKIKSPYYKYIVTKPIPGVQYGIAAPSFWLGAPGGGVQYQLPYSINDLIEAGYLQIIP
jgi:predicted RNA-binding Zn-ribbon protein involved in translation (DUF1610 family)